MAELVVVATYDTSTEAHLARTVLESEDVFAIVQGDHAMSANPFFVFYPGVRVELKVMSEDLAKAKEILGVSDQPEVKEHTTVFQCPECGSNITKTRKLSGKTFLAWLYLAPIIAFLLGIFKGTRRCESCGFSWKIR